jgi:glycosyltransferase involved in cell wall biosynthesis
LVHALRRVGGDAWHVEAAAPRYFHASNDLRPYRLALTAQEQGIVHEVPACATRWVHLFQYGWRTLGRLLARGWDVIHAWEEPYILAGAQIAALAPRRSRYVFRTAQSLNKHYPPPFSWAERLCLARAAGWLCSGRLVAETLRRRPGYAARPHRIIPLGVDADAFRPDPERGRRLLQQWGWQDQRMPVIGFVGRLVPEKGLRLLMRILERVAAPWRLLIVGAGPLEPELRQWAERYSERVRLCTDVSHADVPAYYNALDLLVLPSQTTPRWREQFGRVLIEAMASGVPVVGSDSGEIPYVIADAGAVAPEADEAAWARTLEELLQSPQRRADLAARGRQRCHDRFTWDTVARQHLEFFETLLDAR